MKKIQQFQEKIGDKKKATKSVILGTISYTFKFATVGNLAPQKITYTVLQQSGYKYVFFWLQICFFLATNMFFDLEVAIIEVSSFSMLKIEL